MNEFTFEHGGQLDWNVFFNTLFHLIVPLLPLIVAIIIFGVFLWIAHFIFSILLGGKNEIRSGNK